MFSGFCDELEQFDIVLPPRRQMALWGKNLFHHPQTSNLIKQLGRKFFLITDFDLSNRFSSHICQIKNVLGDDLEVILIPFSEKGKSEETLFRVEKEIFQRGVSKDTAILALGGGVISDLIGYAASRILRGLPLILIPTTLLSMCDACFGGKTAINAYGIKNAIGSFYPAHLLCIDSQFIETLSSLQIAEGLAEIIKCSLTHDSSFFEEIEGALSHSLSDLNPDTLSLWAKRAAQIKMSCVKQDLFDTGERMTLNFGHTFAHALESFSGHSISHGIAVLWGIYFESALSAKLKLLPTDHFRRIERVLSKLIDLRQIPLEVTCQIDTEEKRKAFLEIIAKDKKAKDLPRFVLLKNIGEYLQKDKEFVHPVNIEELNAILESQGWARV